MSFHSDRERYPQISGPGPVISAPLRSELPTSGHDDASYNLGSSADRSGVNYGSDYDTDIPEAEQKRNWLFRTRKRMCLCICCLLVLVLLAIMIPIVIFVIVPAVAQSSVDGSKMVITSSNITSPQEKSFVLKMAGKVTDTGAFDAQIEFKDKVRLYYEGVELGRMAMDPIEAKSGVGATLDSSPTFEITDVEAFGRFSRVMMTTDEFTWKLKGEARVRALGLTIDDIELDKDLTFKGMQGFPGVKINSFDLPSNHPLGGIAMNVESEMNNPSDFSVELGDLTFDIFYNNVRIATANVTGVNLVPGTNQMSMRGRMVPQTSEENLAVVSRMFEDHIAGKSADMKVVGVSVRPNATAEPIPWLQKGFEGLTLNVTLDSDLKGELIDSLELGSMTMVFTPQTAWSPSMTVPNVVARFTMPFGFPLSMKQISQEITVVDGSTDIATLSVPMSPANGSSATGVMTTALKDVPMAVISGKNSAFSSFLRDVTVDKSKTIKMRGNATAVASTAIGDVKLRGIKIDHPVTLQGLQGLSTAPVTLSNVRVTGGTSEALIINLSTTMTNPSNIQLSLGTVNFQVSASNQIVGRAVVENMVLKPGVNTAPTVFYFSPTTDAAKVAGIALLNDFVAGRAHPIKISGYSGSTEVASLREGLSKISLSTSVPSAGEKMLVKTTYSIDLLTVLITKKATVTVTMFNPMHTAVSLVSMKATAKIGSMTLGTINHTFSTPLTLPARGTVVSPGLDMSLQLSLEAMQQVLTAPDGLLILDIDSELVALVGSFPIQFKYSQAGVRSERA